MNCYDCAVAGDHRDAVAVCADCGAAVCVEHAVSARHWLTRTQPLMREVRVEPAERIIRCGMCHAAHVARGDVAAAVPVRSSTL
jgi:hypothetical protein